ncbi:MAG: threonine synthase [Chloroflexota bacterium]|nr:threonine synthase [Chloroflexota bacterium]
MAEIKEMRCVVGGCAYAPDELTYTCPKHGELGALDILYDYAALGASLDRDALLADRQANCWRYKALLPIAPDSPVPPLDVGWTPLYAAPRLARELGLDRAWIKDDGANPTGSLKDRASALVLARALELGMTTVSAASTGNAAAALAGLGAALPETDIVIFVPHDAPEAKVAQLLVYGAAVLLVEGSYDDAFDLCMAYCAAEGWYSRNTGVNPFTTEGKKTVALEIAEQLRWEAPDVVAVSVGDGSIISGLHKGFSDLLRLGWIDKLPRLIGVQAAGSAVLARAWEGGLDAAAIRRAPARTVADSIASELPRDRAKALRAVRETSGAFVTVSDAEILAAIPELAQLSGVFAEPAAAAAFAGAKQAVASGLMDKEESLCLLITGNGLKDVARARQAVSGGIRVAPTVDAVRSALDRANAHG